MNAENVSVVFDRRKKAEATGSGMLEIRVYLNGSRKYFSYCKATPKNWKKIAQSEGLLNEVRKYQKILNAMEVVGEDLTIENLMKHLKELEAGEVLDVKKTNEFNGVDQNQDFIEYMQQQVNAEQLSVGTRKHKQVVIDSLKAYGKIKTFADLTPRKIMDYDAWLHDGTRGDVCIKGYHKKIHKFTRKLRICDMIPSDPYDKVYIKPGQSAERDPLLEEQIVKIRKAVMPDAMTEHARDLFIFSCYTGLAYCDAQHFDFKAHTVKSGDMYYIDGSRIKTATNFFTPILPPAMDILKKYDFKLPHMANQNMNGALKLIRLQLGIRQNMTTHVARHTFATLCLAHGIPMDNVARFLGHKNLRTTQIYAKVLKKTLTDNSEKLAKAIM